MKLSIIYSDKKTQTWATEFAETYGYEVTDLVHSINGLPDTALSDIGNVVIKDGAVEPITDIKNSIDPVAVTLRKSEVNVNGIKSGKQRMADYSEVNSALCKGCKDREEYAEYNDNRRVTRAEVSAVVGKMLFKAGVPSHLSGYCYVKESVICAFLYPHLLSEIMKGLYPYVAERTNTTVHCVERSIRNAVSITADTGSIGNISDVFGCAPEIFNRKLTNGEFISIICEAVKYELKIG